MLKIVKVDTKYINYLRQFDPRVCFNKELNNTRPYVGALYRLKDFTYFAPLTSSGKGNKLLNNPKPESITFYPIENCKYGGVNLNNMIPVIEGVFQEIEYLPNPNDTKAEKLYKILIYNQRRILNKNEKHIREKANKLYSLKTTGRLYTNYDKVTCDFKLLEENCFLYNKNF